MLPAHSKKIALIVVSAIFLFLITVNTSILPGRRTFVDPYGAGTDVLDDEVNGYRGLPSRIEAIFPPPNETRHDYHEWNAQTLRELHVCIAQDNCGPNQQKVALLAAHWFDESVVRGWRGGEGVWAVSVYKHLRGLGYTTFFANNFDEALQQYRMFPELVKACKVVIRNRAGECHSDPKCVKGPTNPSGIPAWKIFDFEYFSSPQGGHYHASLMKGKWILSANPDHKNDPSPIQYIGYSIEDECQQLPTIRLADRENRVWMLMKQLTYVYDSSFAWNRSFFHLASAELGIDFVGGWQVDQHYQWKPEEKGSMVDIEDKPHGVINMGKLGPAEFDTAVGMSKMMIGVGNPWWSPSPYHALCQGVPFLNPILTWNRNDPWNRDHWRSQHPSLQRFDPPYVYHVHADDYEGFVKAVRAGSKTEIPSFIPKHMTEMAVRDRLENLMERDWKAQAEILLEERIREVESGLKSYVFEL